MDYEKAYNAVLETAKQWIKDGCTDKEKICLESVFPELRESEDEKIRKFLYEFIKICAWSEKQYPPRENCLAYLEKQQEPKSDLELIKQSWYTEGYTDGKFKMEPMWNLKTGEGGPRYERNEKYGLPFEQQAAECSEEKMEHSSEPFSCGHENGLLEKLKAEIERIQGYAKAYLCGSEGQAELSPTQYRMEGAEAFCLSILSFIDSLQQEQQVLPGIEDPGIPGKDFIPVEWLDACEMYGKWKIVKQEQPEVDLEKEIQKYFQGHWPGMETPEQCNTDMHFTPPAIMRLVKYAYELGLNARKEESK